MSYDLIVIGAGVAAASALITLEKAGLQIAVIAPSERPQFKIGETLGPAGWNELKVLGISDQFNHSNHWSSFQKFSSWGTPQLLPSSSNSHQSWYLDRVVFEEQLWAFAEQTPFDTIEGKVTHLEFQDGAWQVMLRDQSIQSQYVLDASGRSSIAGRQHFNRTRHDKLVASYTVLEQYDQGIEPTRATLIEARPDGWFYTVLIPGNRMVIAWFTDSDLLPKGHQEQMQYFQNQIHQSEYTLKRIKTAGYQLNNDIQITDASTIMTDEYSIKNLILTGDAAACFDPLSSHGITTALWSGRKSALAIQSLTANDSSPLQGYVKAYRTGMEKYLSEQRHIYQLETHFCNEVFWQRRNGHI